MVLWFDYPSWLLIGFAVSLGLLFGSFLNVVIYRLPRGQNVAYPPSSCPDCGVAIRPWHNVPVFSWLWLRGKAACCGTAISPRYPLVELLGGLAAWAIVLTISRDLDGDAPLWLGAMLFAVHLALCLGLIAAAFIDLEFMILPDSITLGGAALGLVTAPLRDVPWLDSALGALIGCLLVWVPFIWLYKLVRGFPGMGLGDAKLLLLAGAWFGWPGAVFALLAGAVQGTLGTLAVYAAQGKIEEPQAIKQERALLQQQLAELPEVERSALQAEMASDVLFAEPEPGLTRARVPFGPFLILALLEYMFFRPWIHDAFFSFLQGEY